MNFEWMVGHYGALGVLVAMFLESSILPIPSEAVIVAAGYLGIPFWTILWCGALGSTLGACVGYLIGYRTIRWLLERHGRWIGVTPPRLQRFDDLAKRYGAVVVLIGRLFPVIPFKVFSIASGMSRISFASFLLMTFVGVIPRLILLAVIGEWLRRAMIPTLIILSLGGILFFLIRRRKASRACST